MSENIKELLNEEIAAEIQAISSLNSGSEEKSKAIEDLAKLCSMASGCGKDLSLKKREPIPQQHSEDCSIVLDRQRSN